MSLVPPWWETVKAMSALLVQWDPGIVPTAQMDRSRWLDVPASLSRHIMYLTKRGLDLWLGKPEPRVVASVYLSLGSVPSFGKSGRARSGVKAGFSSTSR